MISEKVYLKDGNKWNERHTTEDPATVYESLSRVLRAKYIHRAAWVKRITDTTNYDGTRTITAYYDNGCKSVFTVRD